MEEKGWLENIIKEQIKDWPVEEKDVDKALEQLPLFAEKPVKVKDWPHIEKTLEDKFNVNIKSERSCCGNCKSKANKSNSAYEISKYIEGIKNYYNTKAKGKAALASILDCENTFLHKYYPSMINTTTGDLQDLIQEREKILLEKSKIFSSIIEAYENAIEFIIENTRLNPFDPKLYESIFTHNSSNVAEEIRKTKEEKDKKAINGESKSFVKRSD